MKVITKHMSKFVHKKSKMFIGVSILFLLVFMLAYEVQHKFMHLDEVFISSPLKIGQVTVEGWVSHEKLQALAFEPMASPSKSVNSCHDFWEIGLNSGDWIVEKTERYYAAVCQRLRSLQQVKPAKTNYLKDFQLTQIQFFWPTVVDAAAGASEYGARLADYAHQGLSLAGLVQREIVFIECYSPIDIAFIYESEKTSWLEVARGDFNGDGIEDILVEQDSYAIFGTLSFHKTVLLTRTKEKGMIEVQIL